MIMSFTKPSNLVSEHTATETALIKTINDGVTAADPDHITLLILLDPLQLSFHTFLLYRFYGSNVAR